MQWIPEAVSPGIKRQGHEADHSPSSSAKVKYGVDIPPLSHTPSWNGCQLIQIRDNFTVYIYLTVESKGSTQLVINFAIGILS
jgi:hypothetical protein